MKLLRITLLGCVFWGAWLDEPAASYPMRFVPAASATDMVHDAKRDLLYITNGSNVERYDLVNDAWLSPFVLQGELRGIDLSPNEDLLVVAGGGGFGVGKNGVHVVDLTDDSVDQIAFDLVATEGPTFTAVFTADEELMVSSTSTGIALMPLRRVELSAATSAVIRNVERDTMLAPSANRSTVAYVEPNSSAGPLGCYDVHAGTFSTVSSGRYLFEVGVSRDGSQLAVPTFFGTQVYDAGLNHLDTIGAHATHGPIGLVYSPVADMVFFAWHDDGAGVHPAIDVYDTNTLTPVDTIDSAAPFPWVENAAFQVGRLRMSRDATLLFATVDGGVNVYDVSSLLPEPPSVKLLMVACAVCLWQRRRRATQPSS